MKTLSKMLKAFWQEETGLTIVEYAVAAMMITIIVIGGFTALGTAVDFQIRRVATLLNP